MTGDNTLLNEVPRNDADTVKPVSVDLSRIEEISKDARFKIGNFRVLLSQILAVGSINFILLDLGMILAFPTIVIPDLLKSNAGMHMNEEQASWFGSLALIFQPLGGCLSGLIFEPIGRRKTMLYINIPLLIGWLLILFSTDMSHLYIARVIMGMSIGLMDAPHITYLGEVTQPQWRGILISFAELCVALGFCIVYFLGSITEWKTVTAVCTSIPIISMILISIIPESPIWLLSKGKTEASIRSLRWLRGWVDSDFVREEFENLNRYLEEIKLNKKKDEEKEESLNRRRSLFQRLLYSYGLIHIFRKSVLLPLLLVSVYFGFSHAAGVTNTGPFAVEILNELGTSITPMRVTAISSMVSILGFTIGMLLVPKIGKRSLSMLSMFGCFLINGLISSYGLVSWRQPVIPTLLFILLYFFWSLGIGQIPWMLTSEIFPFRGRGFACGMAAAFSYIEAFVFIKTYYSLYNAFSLSGIFAFYSFCSLIGTFFLYVFLPETEGKTLEQIESTLHEHFKNILFKKKVVFKRTINASF